MVKVGDSVTLPKNNSRLIAELKKMGYDLYNYNQTEKLIHLKLEATITIVSIQDNRVTLKIKGMTKAQQGFSLAIIDPLFTVLNNTKSNINVERTGFNFYTLKQKT